MSDSRTRGDDAAAQFAPTSSVKPSASEVRAALERILASRCFQQAGTRVGFFALRRRADVGRRRAALEGLHDRRRGVRPARGFRRAVRRVGARRGGPACAGASSSTTRAKANATPSGSSCRAARYAVEYHFAERERGVGARAGARDRGRARARHRRAPWRRVAFALGALLVGAVGVITWQQAALREAERALAAARRAAAHGVAAHRRRAVRESRAPTPRSMRSRPA